MLKLKYLLFNNVALFSYYRKGVAYYYIDYEGKRYLFPVPLDDVGSATLLAVDKAILFMRYIRKAEAEKTLAIIVL